MTEGAKLSIGTVEQKETSSWRRILTSGENLSWVKSDGDMIFAKIHVINNETGEELPAIEVNDYTDLIKFTSGNAQASLMHYLLEIEFLTEEEINIFKRGRNSHVHTVRKNMNIQDYLDATGFEALIGYLYLQENIERLKEIVNLAVKKGGA